MKKGRIGVWFSVALAIFLLSLWLGSYLGSTVARYWYRHEQQAQIKSGGPERTHLESTLSRLMDVQYSQMLAATISSDKKLGDKYLLNNIRALQVIERKSDLLEIRPAIDFYIGRAYVYAAIIEEQAHDNQQPSQYMKSAQTLFQSLGWSDYREETLKTMAGRELDKWKLLPQTMESGK
jgi:hypothetical protein